MANPTIVSGDLQVNGTLSAGAMSLPAGSVGNTQVSSSTTERIAATKLIHQFPVGTAQADGADVASRTEMVHVARGSGTLAEFSVGIGTAPAGGDKQYTVDLQKSTGGGTFASMLSAPITVSTADSSRSKKTATLSVTSYSAGDLLRVVVTASGTTGTQGQGMVAVAFLQENPS